MYVTAIVFYWFRIDNKHMSEPWLDRVLMDLAFKSVLPMLKKHFQKILILSVTCFFSNTWQVCGCLKQLSRCHKLWFSNPFIFATWCCDFWYMLNFKFWIKFWSLDCKLIGNYINGKALYTGVYFAKFRTIWRNSSQRNS